MLADEEMEGIEGRLRKRRLAELSEEKGGGLREAMGSLPARVGKGEHEQPLMMAVLQGMQDLSMDVQDLKGAIYRSWEGPPEWTYVMKAVEFRKEYGKMCQQAKGTLTRVGHVKNYVLAGMFMAFKQDKQNTPEDQEEMERIIGKKLRDAEGTLQLKLAKDLDELVAHMQVVQAKKACYINLKLREGEGKKVEELLEKALAREGKRQWDPPAPKPVLRELKEVQRKARGR